MVVDVHESDPGAAGDIEGGHAGTIDIHGEIDEGRSVGFFVRDYAEAGNAVLHKTFIAHAVEAAFADNLGEAGVELVDVEIGL